MKVGLLRPDRLARTQLVILVVAAVRIDGPWPHSFSTWFHFVGAVLFTTFLVPTRRTELAPDLVVLHDRRVAVKNAVLVALGCVIGTTVLAADDVRPVWLLIMAIAGVTFFVTRESWLGSRVLLGGDSLGRGSGEPWPASGIARFAVGAPWYLDGDYVSVVDEHGDKTPLLACRVGSPNAEVALAWARGHGVEVALELTAAR